MADAAEVVTKSFGSVSFSTYSADEVRKMSVVKITNTQFHTGDPTSPLSQPAAGGLYDPSLGLLDSKLGKCRTCGQEGDKCPGHCGHIELVSPAYNPLLFDFLYKLLKRTCFFCLNFRAKSTLVAKRSTQLELISKGDIVGAKLLDSVLNDETESCDESEGSHGSASTIYSGSQNQNDDDSEPRDWTSLQFEEAMSILYEFLKKGTSKCDNCGAKNPKITKRTFGWFEMSGMSDGAIRANIIRGQHLSGKLDGEVDDVVDQSGSSAKKKRMMNAPEAFSIQKKASNCHLVPSEVKSILEVLWENEKRFCTIMSNIQQQRLGEKEAGPSMFFLEAILVPPIKFRPCVKGGDAVMDNAQTILLGEVLNANLALANAHANMERTKVIRLWLYLQQSINVLFDSSKSTRGSILKDSPNGICQILEKKEGLFRQKLMGKRVNYSCRSVISPDPYLGVNEIGIPPSFAIELTYPERVTPWNVAKLRNSVINGPKNHPGANKFVDKQSHNTLLKVGKKQRISISRKLPSSTGAEPGKGSDFSYEGKTVYRHLQDGDIVLVNRQPTLHKPSIMAHVVKVLKGEKTLRMHYANCSTYNADFDGDEMNVHFPQDEISRAEAYNIVNANNQYVKPSNGEPLRSLIQDHIVSSVLLTKRDTFLTQEEFHQLLCTSGVFVSSRTSFNGNSGQKVLLACSEDDLQIHQPAVLKPFPLWTGKQVITAILHHITKGQSVTVEKGAKISSDFFRCKANKHDRNSEKGNKGGSFKIKPDEEKMLVSKNELLRGVIDKAQFGEYGLVHTVQELFGSDTAGTLLSVLSRLFTSYLQMHGFTCGIDDLLILKDKDEARKRQLEGCEKDAELVHRHFIGIKDEKLRIEPMDLQFNIEKIMRSEGESAVAYLDNQMRSALNTKTNSGVINELLSEGALKPSVKNCIYLMTTSGAKGSKVNFQQISSFLGQQELEGKRVPRMVSGKTLPSFHPWDWAARAGGFIIDRFLTGLRPQEYYFHCMAGREGLVDTAVKTSRSGYLQRCLIKNLECLRINYDHTVRDADGSIIQFQYGEDGVDVHQTSFLAKFDSLAMNQEVIFKKSGEQPPMFNSYITELPESLKDTADSFLDDSPLMDRISSNLVKKEDIHNLMKLKFLLSLAQPGESVGVLAAQSVGEPSTQMTLNTFHLAGRGEANVTLGIPRLQEILMTASRNIKTPIMTCPLKAGKTKEVADRIADKFRKLSVADIVKSMEVSVTPFAFQDFQACRIYKLKMQLHRPVHYPEHAKIDTEEWEEALEGKFLRNLEDNIQSHLVLLSKISGIANVVGSAPKSKPSGDAEEDVSTQKKSTDDDDDDDDLGDGQDTEDFGSDANKYKSRGNDEMDYEDDDNNNEDDDLARPEDSATGSESDADDDDADTRAAEDDENEMADDGNSETPARHGKSSSKKREKLSRIESPVKVKDKEKTEGRSKKKLKRTIAGKDYDRAIFVEAKGFYFEVHFRFTNEPHILLAEIARKTSKKVFISNLGKVQQCRATDCKDSQVIYYGKDPTKRVAIKPEEKKKLPALQAMGVDFNAFWKMQNHLDVRYIYTNSIHDMLATYGVEAARETIIREINHVFGSYGISVSNRHLSLIADYMTHTGMYRPMSRMGGISKSTSSFKKMTFETASKFIVQAALHGETDYLEAPSARLCVGLPVKMGTGSFDVMHNLDM
ncbi:DNA-directed RNA polymerase I subunit 1 [Linum perenne]